MKLIAFDGDDTLWQPLSGVNLSDRTPTDEEGWPHFAYSVNQSNPLVAERDDGARFALRPEALDVLKELHRRGLLVGVVSYNHAGNVERILEAFGIGDLVDYVVARWHTNKDEMLQELLEAGRRDGHSLDAKDVLLVDDDPSQIYGKQCERMGVGFCRFGWDITDLRDVLGLLSE